jgi:hypothetical protein
VYKEKKGEKKHFLSCSLGSVSADVMNISFGLCATFTEVKKPLEEL